MKTSIIKLFLVILIACPVQASTLITGTVETIVVQAGFENAFVFKPNSGSDLFLRLCLPIQPTATDANHDFFQLLLKARSDKSFVKVGYIVGQGKDPSTGTNKLCVNRLEY